MCKSLGPPLIYILLPRSQTILSLKVVLSSRSPGFLMLFQRFSLDMGSFIIRDLLPDHFMGDFFVC